MKRIGYLKKAILLVVALVVMSSTMAFAKTSEEYKFKVHNNTKETITKILVSEDGKKFGYFDIGDGIEPGQTVTLTWDQSTNSESCTQYFKAVFESNDESEAVKFDFCEKNLVLEF